MKECLPRPLELEMLLHFYVSAAPYPRSSPEHDKGRAWLIGHGLIQETDQFRVGPNNTVATVCTERGKAHIQSLLCVPLPEQKWETDWNSI